MTPSRTSLQQELRRLYTGDGALSVWFRYALITFDAATIIYFVVTAPMTPTPALILANRLIGVVIICDFSCRLWIADDRFDLLRRVYTIADIVVIASLFVDPFLALDLGFLRILRGLRLVHSDYLLRDLRRDVRVFRRHEAAITALVNLLVFVFFTASAVYTLYFDDKTGAQSYVDALYFTVATLTTTGYGDITLDAPGGKLLSVFVMVVGVALFARLAIAIFRPQKVRHKCEQCGLLLHDPDSVHCKHCGAVLKIETEGLN